jgi:hypothetical protein
MRVSLQPLSVGPVYFRLLPAGASRKPARRATFGLMHHSKSTLLDHLVDTDKHDEPF